MADPVIVSVGIAWTPVATNVNSGRIKIADNVGSMRVTYRETGGAAPTGTTDGGKEDDVEGEYLMISHSTPIDVYMINTREAANVVVWL